MAMKRASQIFRFDHSRQLAFLGVVDLARIFAQFGRDKIESESAVKLTLLADRGNFLGRLVFLSPTLVRREPIFVQSPATLQGPIAKDDIVLLAPGEIAERK